jgi:hypothetical protein
VRIAKPPHGFDISFEHAAKAEHDELCADPSCCRRVVSLLSRLIISGHVEGMVLDDPETPGMRLVVDNDPADGQLSVVYTVKGQTIHIRSIKMFDC